MRPHLAAPVGGGGRRILPALLPGVLGSALLAACSQGAPDPETEQTDVPKQLRTAPAPSADVEGAETGTPLEERVATLGLLNKRNNISQDIQISPGETRRVGDVVLRLASCERTAPWETPPETGAFVQVFVEEKADIDSEAQWNRIFSGWLFKNSPGLNVVEHPIYDVWVKDCTMSFPDEDAPVDAADDTSA